MKRIWIALFLLFAPFSNAFADEYWSETFSPEDKYIELDGNFDMVAFHLSSETKMEFWKDGSWNTVSIENERDPFSQTSALFSWVRGEKMPLRLSGTKKVVADFARLDPEPIVTASTALPSSFSFVSRKEWGADESFRYTGEIRDNNEVIREIGNSAAKNRAALCADSQEIYPDEFEVEKTVKNENGHQLVWPYQYSKKIRKVVIHHTAETSVEKGLSAAQVMKGIYRYHAVTRGWGDIGYHFVIAPDGTIFEGKAGGDFVVGGHTYCNNIGTLGIALMGNFEKEKPTVAQMNALRKILPVLAEKYELDLTDTEYFHGRKTPNLLGHRDFAATACPGKNMYENIPLLRRQIATSEEIAFVKQFQIDGKPANTLGVVTIKSGQKKNFVIGFKNTGAATWDGNTWLFSQAGEGVKVESLSTKKKYIAAKMRERSVAPGEIAHFSVNISAGYKGGLSTISFVPVVSHKRVANAETLQLIEVPRSEWSARILEVKTEPKNSVVGRSISLFLRLKNTGDTRWKMDDMALTVKILGTQSSFSFSLQKDTLPGETGIFLGQLPAPKKKGKIVLRLQLFLAGRIVGFPFIETLNVGESKNAGVLEKDNRKILFVPVGKNFEKTIFLKNTGNETWKKEDLSLVILNKRKRTLLSPDEKEIAPGESARFHISIPITTKRILPLLLFAKDRRQTLARSILLVRGKDEEKADSLSPPIFDDALGKSIRIRLSFFSKISTRVTANSSVSVFNLSGRLITTTPPKSILNIHRVGSQVSMNGNLYDGLRFLSTNPEAPLIVPDWKHIPAWDTEKKWNDNRFYGFLELRVLENKIAMINELPLEYYLLGIGETIEADPPEKKKALAVVARTYAAFYQEKKNRKFPKMPYDGSDNPAEFQKYLGANLFRRSPKWARAVADTKGEVLTFEGEIIKTPFHTCAGGQTVSALEKWGWTNTPYLQSVADPGGVGKARSGHGVGLSACSAKYFAEKKGWGYRKILEYFFPGTQIQ